MVSILNEKTSPEVELNRNQNIVAILPCGAIEQHGPHLPLATDILIAKAIVEKSLEKLANRHFIYQLPSMSYGVSTEHENFAGTLSLSPQTFIAVVLEISQSLKKSGIQKIIFANGHGGNGAALDIVCQQLRTHHNMCAVHVALHRLGLPSSGLQEADLTMDMHAGAVETALIRAIAPHLVNEDKVRNFALAANDELSQMNILSFGRPATLAWNAEDINPHGAIGNALLGTLEWGKEILQFRSDKLALIIKDVSRLTP